MAAALKAAVVGSVPRRIAFRRATRGLNTSPGASETGGSGRRAGGRNPLGAVRLVTMDRQCEGRPPAAPARQLRRLHPDDADHQGNAGGARSHARGADRIHSQIIRQRRHIGSDLPFLRTWRAMSCRSLSTRRSPARDAGRTSQPLTPTRAQPWPLRRARGPGERGHSARRGQGGVRAATSPATRRSAIRRQRPAQRAARPPRDCVTLGLFAREGTGR